MTVTRGRWAQGLGAALILGAAVGSAGCTGAQFASPGPFHEGNVKSARRSATRYFLAKDILLVEAEIKQSRVTTLRAENDGANHFFFATKTRLKFDGATASITPKTVPDTSAFFQVELENGDASEDNVTVEVTDQGLLRSVNATSESKAGDIVKNVAQVAATVAAVAGALGARDPNLIRQIQGLFDREAQSIPRLKESLTALPLDVLYLLQEQPDARVLWAKKLKLEAQIDKRGADRAELEEGIQKLSKADIDVRKAKLDLLAKVVARLQDERKSAIDQLSAMLEQLWKDKHLTTEPVSRKISVAFDLEEVPPPSLLEEGMDPGAVKAKLTEGKFTKMADLFDDAGVVFTLTPPPIAEGDPNAPAKPGAAPAPEVVPASEGRFYFRQSFPLVLRSFAKATLPASPKLAPAKPAPPVKIDIEAKNKGVPQPAPVPSTAPSEDVGDKEQIRFVEDRIVDLIPRSAPELYVSFAPKDFATRRLSLSFDEKGRLARLERSSTSALAGETSALAEGVTRARNEYARTLDRLVQIQDAKRQLSLEDLQGQIDRAQAQRDLIDARVALEGAGATADLNVQKQRLDAELATLNSRAALEAAQRGSSTAPDEVAQLKTRLDQLTQEIADLKARIDANRGGGGTGSTPGGN